MMRAVRFSQFGAPSVLKVEDLPKPMPGDDEVLIQIKAAAINPSDVKNVQGMMPHTKLPRTPGRDFAGVVVEGPSDLIGVEVWGSGGELGFEKDGSHAEYLRLPKQAVRPKPHTLSFEEAAAVGVPFITAWSALMDTGQLAPGETVAIIGAAGAVGSSAVQVARWMNGRVIGIVRNAQDAERLRGMDALPVVSQEPAHLGDGIKAATDGKGADLILDTVGGPLFEAALTALAPRSRLIEITTPERRVSFDLLDFYRRDLRLFGVNTLALEVVAGGRILEALTPGFESGALQAPKVAERYPLSEAVTAYERVARGGGGKVLLTP